MPTQLCNAQPLVSKKQLLWEENPKLLNVMQYHTDSYVGNINMVRKYSHYVIFTFLTID